MAIELKIPSAGESISEVQISEWLKSEGDTVKQDEPIAVIDSGKATFELPAPEGGRLTKILRQAGETVAVGTVVAELEPGEIAEKKTNPKETPTESEKRENEYQPPKPPPPNERETAKAAKSTDQAAAPAENEMPGSKVEKPASQHPAMENTGKGISSKFREGAKSPPSLSSPVADSNLAGREEEIVPMTMLRRTAAHRLVEAQHTMAMLTTFNEADMSAIQALRNEYQEQFEKRHQVKLGLMSFFIKAAIDALNQFPQLNAEIRGNDIIYRNYFDIGVAVATERGLVVPVIRDAGRLAFAELEKSINDFGRRAKDGRLKPNELGNGTFTITNGGVFGSLLSTPIINPPQTGILGLHAIQERPVAIKGQVEIRPMMYVALTYDHRLVDGREAVLFLRRIKQAVETPARMLIEV